MKLHLIALSLLALLAGCQQAAVKPSGTGAQTPWVAGYYVGYIPFPLEQVEWKGLTHLMIGPVLPKSDGTLEVSMYTANGPQLARAAVQAAKANGVKAVAFVGGMDTGPQWADAASDANRAKFVANLVKLMRDYGFDGLDLDWEPVRDGDQQDNYADDRPSLLALAKDLRAAAPQALLTFPADGASNSNFPTDRAFFAQLSTHLDQLNLMTYGMAGTWPGWRSWHSAALYHPDTPGSPTPTSLDYTVSEYLKAGVPREKLGIGIGFYGICYSAPVNGPAQELKGSTVVASDNDISYANILKDYYQAAARRWDDLAKVPYLSFASPSGPKGCTYISYDDPDSIREKAAYAKAKGLGGAILWNVNEGYVEGLPQGERNPLLGATGREFLGVR